MMLLRPIKRLLPLLALAVLGAGCAPGTPANQPQTSQEPLQPKRISTIILSNPPMPSRQFGGSNAGIDELEELVNAGLANITDKGQLQPQLADTVPTLENGLWKVLPDGKMEITWKLKGDAQWHDGAPFTAADVLFAAKVAQDPDIPVSKLSFWRSVDSVEAPDPRTVIIRWGRSYYAADRLFTTDGQRRVLPLPRHLLEEAYTANPAGFVSLPFWTEGFVGTGAYRIREWVPGSHVVLTANDRYALGKPKVDEITMRFVTESTAAIAQVLAGGTDMVIGRGLSLDQAIQIRDNWPAGRVDISISAYIYGSPQHISPEPSLMADPRFKRALLRAMDRQQMADTFLNGVSGPADSILSTEDPDYPTLKSSIVHYDYDPRAAIQGLQELGLTRGADGMFRDTSGNQLTVEVRSSTGQDVSDKATLAIADYWKAVGISGTPFIVPAARRSDREFGATFPGVDIARTGLDPAEDKLSVYHTSQLPLAENRFAGTNKSRYSNPELDGLIDRLITSIAKTQRTELMGRVLHLITDQVVTMALFYDIEATPSATRIQNAAGRKVWGSTQVWNSENWDVSRA